MGLSLQLVLPQASPQVFSALVSPAKGTNPSIPHPHSQQIGRSCQGLTTGQWYSPAQQAGSGNLRNGKVQPKLLSPIPLSSGLPKPWHSYSHRVLHRIRGPFLLSYRILCLIVPGNYWARNQTGLSQSSKIHSTSSINP